MGTWGLGDMVRSIGSHTNTFRVRHGDMGARGLGDMGWDMGFRGHGAGHGDMGFRGHGSFYWITGRDMGTWGLGDMVRSIGSHTNTFRDRHGEWGHGDIGLRRHGGGQWEMGTYPKCKVCSGVSDNHWNSKSKRVQAPLTL